MSLSARFGLKTWPPLWLWLSRNPSGGAEALVCAWARGRAGGAGVGIFPEEYYPVIHLRGWCMATAKVLHHPLLFGS